MFQLFQIRGFGEFISDTFQFLKNYGKNYFKNYLKHAFVALLLLMVSMALIGTFYYRVLITTVGFTGTETYDNAFVTENVVLLIVGMIAIVIISLYLALLNYSYPVYYLRLVGENPNKMPELQSIKTLVKNDFGRLLLFGLLSVIVFSIIGIVAFSIAAILSFVIIGIFIFILLMPTFITWYSLTLYYYLNKNQSFFDALKYAFYTITNNFWNIIGANLCMLIIVYVLSMAVTMIPYMIMMITMVLGMEGIESSQSMNSSNISIFLVVMVIVYCFSILVSMLLNHLLLIQTGLVYYSEREKLEQNTMRQSIDEIGKHE
ncbi:hypothetical protein H1R17_09210 [Flavobacterium sp. xlx-214]|uniref:hypothetical protein n=1 Tax=unclassified Flavobacterium TaxID=196869 RepID=UPI0013D708C7|nr:MULTISPECIES: hypothetical protein [unclassified Flavobacterium]MBA5793984.1 hypothetical protein [Flavobacterium sp. xlx-221]QMI82647.1 hypothetical protein H1R17_09210 [Flavobacterium sp. xlx-214]